MAVDRATILKASLVLLDKHGLDGVTMRRLAQAVGVQAPSLYWHYRDKQALLADMAEALVEQVDWGIDRRQDFRLVVQQLAERLLFALLARRDGATVYAATTIAGPNHARLVNSCIVIFTTAGFDSETATRSTGVLFSYILGHALVAQAHMQRGTLSIDQASVDHTAQFGFGVRAIIAGMGPPIEDAQVVALMRVFSSVRQA